VLKITALGVGGWVSHPSFGQSGYVVSDGKRNVLLDCGEGTYYKLSACGINIKNLDYIILTHIHGDHVLGLPTLAQIAAHENLSLKVVTLEEVFKNIVKLFEVLAIEKYLNHISFVELPLNDELVLEDDLIVKSFKALHPVLATSLLIRIGEYRVAYSGDTAVNKDFLLASEGVDVLLHEVSLPELYDSLKIRIGHTSEKDLEDIVNIAKPKTFIPVHFYMEPPKVRLDNYLKNTKLVYLLPCSSVVIE